MASKQYAVPTPSGVIYVNEANAGDEYALPGAGYLNDTSTAPSPPPPPVAASSFFLVI